MSEVTPTDPASPDTDPLAAPADAAPRGPGGSAGQLLRAAREAAGLHIGALAVMLKVPVTKLEALEADRIDDLPDPVFARALAASVCRSLKVDPAPILQLLPHSRKPTFQDDSNRINAPFVASRPSLAGALLRQLARPVPLASMLLVLGAIGLIVFTRPAREAASLAPALSTASVAVAATPTAAAAPAGVTENVTPALVFATSIAGAASAPAPVGALPPLATLPLPATAAAAPLPGDAPLLFRTREESWINVTDGKGSVALNRIVPAGEVAAVNGTPPFRVVIGRADATEVQVRGKPFALADVTRDNVARFEVK